MVPAWSPPSQSQRTTCWLATARRDSHHEGYDGRSLVVSRRWHTRTFVAP
jgi:hypothetical protein